MKYVKNILVLGYLFGFINTANSQDIKPRSCHYYLQEANKLEFQELLDAQVILDSVTIAPAYLDSATKYLNKEGSEKYLEIKMQILSNYFNDYLYLQHVIHKENVYVLFFSLAGFDDMSWDIVKFTKENYQVHERFRDFNGVDEKSFKHILSNYDEGPKNDENVRIFIINNYLVMERENLYHSLYDLTSSTVLVNEESPWHAASPANYDEKELDEWIRINLHEKINEIINKKRD
ncbi:MAG: hypothetical protein ACSHWW_05005 [Nonlabens sp.]|uniref:hypothetical protein n=1 Tax=Nonlabens sp. TaxID=1888209 RepID=UPI003EF193A3